MKTLETNVLNVWGEKGKIWLASLPTLIKQLAKCWSLTDIKPVNNMSYNYVALALQNNLTPVVLKISCDEQLILKEYKALNYFNGQGAIKVIAIDTSYNALLLEQAVPGYLLKEHHPVKIDETIEIYAKVVKTLAKPLLTDNNYTHVSKWCNTIDRIKDRRIEKYFVEKAKSLKSLLLNSTSNEYLCHGDLHLENIIQHEMQWLSIDPKGIIGEMAFEAAAFDLLNDNEMQDTTTILPKLSDRIAKLSTALELNANRLLSWFFLRTLISAQWFIEDNGNPDRMLVLAAHFYSLLEQSNLNHI